MKRIHNWLKRKTPQQYIGVEAQQCAVGVRVRPERNGVDEYRDDVEHNWQEEEPMENSCPETSTLVQDDYEVTVPHAILKLEEYPVRDAKEKNGNDPYSTGCFDSAKLWESRPPK